MEFLKTITFFFLISISIQNAKGQDWANLGKYLKENAAAGKPKANEKRVVFMGDSITEEWGKLSPDFFKGKPFLNRGISGQTTAQMLVRFRQDVINLDPHTVIILAGTNDIAGNTGPVTMDMIKDNFQSMTELARGKGVNIILCSVLPVKKYFWKPALKPSGKILELNKWLKTYSAENKFIYVDFYMAMADAQNGLKSDLTKDGVHPNVKGYKIMNFLVEKAIKEILDQK